MLKSLNIILAIVLLLLLVGPTFAETVDTAWVRRYDGTANPGDYAYDLAVDNSGNVYVTGYSRNDYATIKYYDNGDTAWVRRYNGTGNSWDEVYSIAVDNSGNVYVTGESWGTINSDYATIKYYANGDTAWVRRYSGTANYDRAFAIAVDDSGNVYVTGESQDYVTNGDYATIKYRANGDTAWVRRYEGGGLSSDAAHAIAVDKSGNIYVTGGTGAWSHYATIKYHSNGDTAWVRTYDGPGNSSDQASDIAVDDSGNVYVTGSSEGSGTSYDYATIKYLPNGDTAWVRRYNGPGDTADVASAIAVDSSGNVYVTGESYGSGTDKDFATIKYYPNGDTAWVRRYDSPEHGADRAFDIALDADGNVYVTGVKNYDGGASEDYATIKYSPSGNQIWVKTFNGSGNGKDSPSAIGVSSAGNIYVTGNSRGIGTYEDYATIKYDSDGDTLWARTYNGPGTVDDLAYDVAVDDSGNVFVTGVSTGVETYTDYATIKYYPNGDTAWVRRYSETVNFFDWAWAVAVDGSGNAYVTGWSDGDGTVEDYATIKYYPDGDTAWVRRYDGPDNSIDEALAMVVDDSGYVYVTGKSTGSGTYNDYATIKYRPDGDTAWVRRYNGPGNYGDWASAITVDRSGNVYVTGTSYGGYDEYLDFATIKYYPNGDTVWVRRYNRQLYSGDWAYAMAVDDSGNVYVTGISDLDGLTVKYYSNGDTAWTRSRSNETLLAIAVDDAGNVYVTGTNTIKYSASGDQLWVGPWGGHDLVLDNYGNAYVCGGGDDYRTVKYRPSGDTAWVMRYNGPGNAGDEAYALAIDSSGNIYVTGVSVGNNTGEDYATIKYVQSPSDVEDETESSGKPSEFALSQNYPNPFNPSTTIHYTVDSPRSTVHRPVHTTQDRAVDGSQFTVHSPIPTTQDRAVDGSQFMVHSPIPTTQDRAVDGSQFMVHSPIPTTQDRAVDGSQFMVHSPILTTQDKAVDGSQFTVHSPIHTTLKIYNVLGEIVRTLVDELKWAGDYSVQWDGKDDKGEQSASGVYFYELKIGDYAFSKKMVLLK